MRLAELYRIAKKINFCDPGVGGRHVDPGFLKRRQTPQRHQHIAAWTSALFDSGMGTSKCKLLFGALARSETLSDNSTGMGMVSVASTGDEK